MPRSRNPETGWAVTCNQRVVGDDYPYFLTTTFGSDYRARRIIEHIENAKSDGKKINVEDMAAFHADTQTVPGGKLVKRLQSMNPDDLANQSARQALKILQAWDRRLDADSVGAVVYSAVNDQISLALMERNYGIDPDDFAAKPDLNAIDHLRRQLKPAFINALESDEAKRYLADHETIDTFLAEIIAESAEQLERRYGDVDAVAWSDVHVTKQIHPLADTFPEAADELNAPAIGTAGDGDVPFATGSRPSWHFRTGSGPVNRYLHDPSNWSAGRWVVPLGVSGNAGCVHRHDQQKFWANVTGIPQLFDWETIEKTATTSQIVKPDSG